MDELSEIRESTVDRLHQIPNKVWIVFAVATSIMVLQHLSGWSWDFLVYSMNGEYMFSNGMFMEWLRPPLASVLIGIPQLIVSRAAAEIIFILTVSVLMLYSSYRVSEEYNLSFEYFYLLLMMPATIYYGTVNGTEMLSLAFAMLFFAELNKSRTGIWLGLTFLTRYNYGAIIPLTLVQRDLKKSIKTILISSVPVALWLSYNYFQTGHFLKSFADYLGLNILRRSAHDPLNPINFILIGLPVSITLLLYFKKNYREKISLMSDETLFMAVFVLINSILYVVSGLKPLRYLYPLVLPIAFYSTKALQEFEKLSFKEYTLDADMGVNILSVISLILAGILILQNPLPTPSNFEMAAESADGCMVESNVWPMISYAGTPAISITYRDREKIISEGYRIIDYTNSAYDNSSDLPIIESNELFTVYGNETLCKEPELADRSWLTGLNQKTGKNFTPESFLLHEVRSIWNR